MYRVITVDKRNKQEVGYLGDFDDQQEAIGVVKSFNRKADRHPVLAQIKQLDHNQEESEEWEEESEWEEDSGDFHNWEEESEEVSEEEESEEESELDEVSFNSNPRSGIQLKTNEPPQNREKEFRSNRGRERRTRRSDREPLTQRRTSPIRNERPFMFTNPQEDRFYGIIIDDKGKILLREPANHYHNIRWEFYGGTPEEGETPQDTVIRETAEETGYTTRPIGKIGIIENDGKTYHYYLLKRLSRQRNWKNFGTKKEETWDTIFVSRSDAEYLLGQNADSEYKKSLIGIMDKAYELWRIRNRETE